MKSQLKHIVFFRTGIWQRAKKASLTQGQNEVKVNNSLPWYFP